MTWPRVNRVIVAVLIWSAPVWRFTSARALEREAPVPFTGSRIFAGTAALVSLRDAFRIASLPNTSIAAPTADSAS